MFRGKLLLALFCALAYIPRLAFATNFTECLANIQSGVFGEAGLAGARDNQGLPVTNISTASAITYGLCIEACGSAPEAFSWTDFSSQFSAWLLPWLALVSQLPFGSQMRSDDFTSFLLALGSPTLAAYSLAMTVLNGQWLTRRLSGIRYPNVRHAWGILSSLQQSALYIDTSHGLLTSLVVLRENDEWWSELERELNYTQTWSVSAISQIAWVVIAYCTSSRLPPSLPALTTNSLIVITVINDLTSLSNTFIGSGQANGALFLWLLPIGAQTPAFILPHSYISISHRLVTTLSKMRLCACTQRAGQSEQSQNLYRNRGLSEVPPGRGCHGFPRIHPREYIWRRFSAR
jgi:hypothetical protein